MTDLYHVIDRSKDPRPWFRGKPKKLPPCNHGDIPDYNTIGHWEQSTRNMLEPPCIHYPNNRYITRWDTLKVRVRWLYGDFRDWLCKKNILHEKRDADGVRDCCWVREHD